MKKVIAAMVVMFLVIVPLGGIWSLLFKSMIGGGAEQSFIYPIYAGLILLSGLVVGAAAIIYEEIEKLRNDIKSIMENAKE